MGWDIQAYYDVNQEEIEEFINKNNIDREDWDQNDKISSYFKETYFKDKGCHCLGAIYSWNEKCGIHEVFDYYRVSFIRDDERFTNRRYQQLLEKEIGEPFPYCLTHICTTIYTKNDAIKVAEALETFFKDDEHLMDFAEWLKETAKYCSTYELSY
jgi:hypothetical protein